jgi:hypothetical protein
MSKFVENAWTVNFEKVYIFYREKAIVILCFYCCPNKLNEKLATEPRQL